MGLCNPIKFVQKIPRVRLQRYHRPSAVMGGQQAAKPVSVITVRRGLYTAWKAAQKSIKTTSQQKIPRERQRDGDRALKRMVVCSDTASRGRMHKTETNNRLIKSRFIVCTGVITFC